MAAADASQTVGQLRLRDRRHKLAEARLDAFFRAYDYLGQSLSGEVAECRPEIAVKRAMATEPFDEIIISTHLDRTSLGRRLDLPTRLRRAFGVPVATLVQ